MNLYIRYFDDECVVTSVEEALQFIGSIPGFAMTGQFAEDFRQYAEGSLPFPKRYKVRPRVYFIVIKTTASTLAEFKANGKGTEQGEQRDEAIGAQSSAAAVRPADRARQRLLDEQPGWYEATVNFKRVVVVPETGKFDYKDTTFVARLKARSGQDCYNRMIDHLRTRSDVDPRSQFPSVKGKNFSYVFLGLKPYEQLAV